MFKLRKYQQDAVDAVIADIDKPGNSLVVLPTAGGKSIVQAEAAQTINKPVIILSPSREILSQNKSKLERYIPAYNIGVYSASFNKTQVRKFTFATIQSVYKKPHLFDHFGLVFVDESDLMDVQNAKGMFTSFLKAIGDVKCFGHTATPYRNTQGYRKEGGVLFSNVTLKLINRIKPDFWKRIIFNINNKELLEQGYLCPIKYYDRSAFDHKDIPLNKSQTDFDFDKFSDNLKPQRSMILDLIQRASKKMNSVLVFCNSVSEARNFAREIPSSRSVDGETPKDDRDAIIADFKSGRIKVVFNCQVLTVGFDHPELDCIFLLRPTRSLRLYQQMCGRGIRIAPGKEACIVVDFTANVKNFGRIETIELVQEKRLLDSKPMWYLKSETSDDWHNHELYSYRVPEKGARRKKWR